MLRRHVPALDYFRLGRTTSGHPNQGCLLQALNALVGGGIHSSYPTTYHPHFDVVQLSSAIMTMNDNPRLFNAGFPTPSNPSNPTRIKIMFERLAALVLIPRDALLDLASRHIPTFPAIDNPHLLYDDPLTKKLTQEWTDSLPSSFENFFAATDAYLLEHFDDATLKAHNIFRDPPTAVLSSTAPIKEPSCTTTKEVLSIA